MKNDDLAVILNYLFLSYLGQSLFSGCGLKDFQVISSSTMMKGVFPLLLKQMRVFYTRSSNDILHVLILRHKLLKSLSSIFSHVFYT